MKCPIPMTTGLYFGRQKEKKIKLQDTVVRDLDCVIFASL